MNSMIHPAYYHHAYHSYGTSDWVTHMIVSAVVHSLIYGVIFKLMRSLSMPEAIVLVGLGLLGVYWWSRRRDRMG